MTSHHPIDGPSCSRCNGPQDHRSINRRLWCDQCVRQAGPAISAFQRPFHAKDKELAGIITTYISDLVSIRFVDDGVSHARRRLLTCFPARRGARFADEGRRWHNQERAIMKLTTVARRRSQPEQHHEPVLGKCDHVGKVKLLRSFASDVAGEFRRSAA